MRHPFRVGWGLPQERAHRLGANLEQRIPGERAPSRAGSRARRSRAPARRSRIRNRARADPDAAPGRATAPDRPRPGNGAPGSPSAPMRWRRGSNRGAPDGPSGRPRAVVSPSPPRHEGAGSIARPAPFEPPFHSVLAIGWCRAERAWSSTCPRALASGACPRAPGAAPALPSSAAAAAPPRASAPTGSSPRTPPAGSSPC